MLGKLCLYDFSLEGGVAVKSDPVLGGQGLFSVTAHSWPRLLGENENT